MHVFNCTRPEDMKEAAMMNHCSDVSNFPKLFIFRCSLWRGWRQDRQGHWKDTHHHQSCASACRCLHSHHLPGPPPNHRSDPLRIGPGCPADVVGSPATPSGAMAGSLGWALLVILFDDFLRFGFKEQPPKKKKNATSNKKRRIKRSAWVINNPLTSRKHDLRTTMWEVYLLAYECL